MPDILQELHDVNPDVPWCGPDGLFQHAANEIERLRARCAALEKSVQTLEEHVRFRLHAPIPKIAEALTFKADQTCLDLQDWTGLNIATLYVTLMQMEETGTVTSHWEDMPYPRRRRYRLVK